MKTRLKSLFGVCILVAAVYGVYLVKWEVRELRQDNTLLSAQMLREEGAVRVLEAEWAYLNRPDRLRELAELYLDVTIIHGSQLADVEAMGVLQSSELASDEQGVMVGVQLSGMGAR